LRGGGGGDDLSVSFSFGSTSGSLFMPVDLVPVIGGLSGNTPRCEVIGGSLPPGVAITGDCRLAGVPTRVGTFDSTISLRVDGFKGSVTSPARIAVIAPVLQVVASVDNPAGGPAIALGRELTRFEFLRIEGNGVVSRYVPQAGDVLSFRVTSGAPPPGTTLDEATGTLNGTPTGFGPSDMAVALTITRQAATFTTDPVTVTTATIQAPWTLTYPSVGDVTQGDDVALLPVSTVQPVAGATTVFRPIGSLPPDGVSLDPETGALTGWLVSRGETIMQVEQEVTFPDGSVQSTISSTLAFRVSGPIFSYGNASSLRTDDGQPFSYPIGPIVGSLPGDVVSFSIADAEFGTTAPLPAWVQIDAATGTIFGVGGPRAQPGDNYAARVTMTTTRNGRSFSSTLLIGIFAAS
jgi:large repetitive protein